MGNSHSGKPHSTTDTPDLFISSEQDKTQSTQPPEKKKDIEIVFDSQIPSNIKMYCFLKTKEYSNIDMNKFIETCIDMLEKRNKISRKCIVVGRMLFFILGD